MLHAIPESREQLEPEPCVNLGLKRFSLLDDVYASMHHAYGRRLPPFVKALRQIFLDVASFCNDVLGGCAEENLLGYLIPFSDAGGTNQSIRLAVSTSVPVVLDRRHDACDG